MRMYTFISCNMKSSKDSYRHGQIPAALSEAKAILFPSPTLQKTTERLIKQAATREPAGVVPASKRFIFRPRPGVADEPVEVFFYLIPVE